LVTGGRTPAAPFSREFGLESIQSLWPQPRVAIGPLRHLIERAGDEAVDTHGTPRLHGDDAGLQKRAQLVRDGGLADSELRHHHGAHLASGALAVGEYFDDAAPYRVGEDAPKVPDGYTDTIVELCAAGRRGDAVAFFMTQAVGQPPEAVEQAMDRRTSMGVVGDLEKYAQYQAAEAMRAAAENPGAAGGGMGAGIGAGMGMAMAHQMASPWGGRPGEPQAGAQPAAAPPPPPSPAEAVYHIAENGQTHGPYSLALLGRMIHEGGFTRETLAWSPGFAGWMKAGEVDQLARLFAVAPPPPPPPAA